MIVITMINGNVIKWENDEYTDYECRDQWFYIIYNNAYVGYYNMNYVSDITVNKTKELPKFSDSSIDEKLENI